MKYKVTSNDALAVARIINTETGRTVETSQDIQALRAHAYSLNEMAELESLRKHGQWLDSMVKEFGLGPEGSK